VAIGGVSAMPAMSQELEEVIVSATRRQESAQAVPISITAISADSLGKAGISGVKELQFVTTGLQIANRSAAFVPYIRGIGTLDVAAGQETAVAVYIDGVYLSSVWGTNMSFSGIDRVEVLKGPQGTLFGRNATGGLIHIITKDPSHETKFNGSVSYGNYNTVGGKFYATTGITNNLAADFSAYYENQNDTYGRNVLPGGPELIGTRDYGARSKWLWNIDDANKLTFAIDYSRRRGGQGDDRALNPGSVSNFGPLGTFTALPNPQDVQLNFPVFHDVKAYGAAATYEHKFAGVNFKSITAYRGVKGRGNFDNDGLPAPIVNVENRFSNKTFTEEIQFLSNDDKAKVSWIAGAFFMHDTNGYDRPGGLLLSGAAFIDALGPGSGFTAFGFSHEVKTTSYAVFAEGTFKLTDATRLIAGARWINDKKEISGGTEIYTGTGAFTGIDPTFAVFSPFAPNSPAGTGPGTATWKKPTFRLALNHDLTAKSMIYTSYNRGFRSGAYNTVSVSGTAVNPESVDAFEIGSKNTFLDNRLRFNIAAFHSNYKNLQIPVAVGSNQFLFNVGKAKISGFEVEAEAAVSAMVTANLGLTYLHTKFDGEGRTLPCTSQTAAGATVGFSCDPTGNEMVRAPKTAINAGINFDTPISVGRLGANANVFWTAKFFWEPDNRLIEPAYAVVNADVYWTDKSDRYTIKAYGKNLFDENYSSFSVAQAGLNDQHSAAPPRTYGLEFGFKF
jgi:iron complex outermembrane recepter protein